MEVAKVGSRTDPETKDIERYRIGNLVLWDTPGLGDGTEIDEHHRNVIAELLLEDDGEDPRSGAYDFGPGASSGGAYDLQ